MGRLLSSRFGIIIIALAGLAIYWFSNQQEVPFTGRTQFNTMSIEDSARLGAESYVQILQQEQGNVLCRTNARSCQEGQRELVATVNEIGDRLVSAAIRHEQELLDAGYSFTPVADKFQWTYNVVASDQPNAFCLPGGYVAIYTGILDITGNYD
ncbi:MAG: M48 family metalloprotease, partial [Pseudomonadota bacterium]